MTPPAGSVCLDVQGMQTESSAERGIARAIDEVVRALLAAAPEVVHSILVSPSRPFPGRLEDLLATGLVHRHAHDPPRGSAGRPLLYHLLSPFESLPLDEIWPQWARRPSMRTVLTVHDVIPLALSEHYLANPRWRARYLARLQVVRAADNVVTSSRSAASDLVEHGGVRPSRLTVTGLGVSDVFATRFSSQPEASAWSQARWPELRSSFVLYVGGYEYRKNIDRLISAYGHLGAGLRARHQLVIACRLSDDQHASVRALGAAAGVAPDELVLTGYVTDEELAALYHACALFVFPSFYEGFGLPMVEAMSCGAPVIAASNTTGPEILGGVEGTFDPFDVDAIAECIRSALTTPGELERLRRRSAARAPEFTWQRVAERVLGAYESALAQPRPSTQSARPRLALFTPWPPEQSGIAEYSRRMVPELARHADVDIVVAGDGTVYEDASAYGARVVAWERERLLRHIRAHDRVLYTMGNSHFHIPAYVSLQQRRGAVVFHDARLTGLYWRLETTRMTHVPGWYARKLAEHYGDRRVPLEQVGPGHSPAELDAQRSFGIYMTAEIQRMATLSIVHSEHAAAILRMDAGTRDAADIVVVPQAVSEGAPRVPRPRGRPDLIVSCGQLAAIKHIDLLLLGFQAHLRDNPAARLVFAGFGDHGERDRWRQRSRDLGLSGSVEFRIELPPTEYRQLLASADIAVQLRRHSNGEASGAVCDCLAARLPTIVTDIGWYSELPPDVVDRVPVSCSPEALATAMLRLLRDDGRRRRMTEAQDAYARERSFAAVARMYLEALDL